MKKFQPLVCFTAMLLTQGCWQTSTHSQRMPPHQHAVCRPSDTLEAGKIVLGSSSLTAGITGSGPLSVEEIERWLSDPENHETLNVILPIGLRRDGVPPAIPQDNPLTRAKIELGRQLYFDDRLSMTGFTCGLCHPPGRFFSHSSHNLDPTLKDVRTVPVTFNRILGQRQLWDGRAASLEEHALLPIFNPRELASSRQEYVQTLSGLKGYRMQCQRIFGEVSMEAVSKAIASFERCLVTFPSPYDYRRELRCIGARHGERLTPEEQKRIAWLKQQAAEHPMSPAAKRGEALFYSERIGCWKCHSGANFTDEAFHNIGIGMDAADPDLGRYQVTKEPADYGAFKTPTLRNVAHSSPYMHRGQLKSLEEVVQWYAHGGFENKGLSPRIRPFKLSDDEERNLVEFLKSLSSPVTPVERQRLPDDTR